ncbi:MAG TPA: tRNA guanosine(34) transglycosylase Tgt [Chthoniobacteraceae bacterium]|nr:tRNA guanosine(34) transglycosylase Tgt [Chthoniobacteraceae bacterium]
MFELLSTDTVTKARRGRITTRHGVIETPVFMPVGTQGSVKAVSPRELTELGAQIILGNTYHLFVRPGMEVMNHFGGLHQFMNWRGPILTDSGGFQVFSLAKLRKITEEGVHFQNHLDGTPCFIGPETAMDIQRALGSDIAMAFDECPPYPCERDYAEKSLGLTQRWAKRCKAWCDERDAEGAARPAVFGIAQGATFADLRRRAAEELAEMNFEGYAVGGVSVGEPESEMMAAVENAEPYLPAQKPRYAMGLGTPPQMLEMIARGIDMFDCVLPTRIARNGTAFTAGGTINLKNACYTSDKGPIEEGCACPACGEFTRGYIRHLVKAEEILGLRLVTLHNLWFYLNLMTRARAALETNTFDALRKTFVENYAVREIPG